MPDHALHRLLESFFRHPLLHLLPLAAFVALGIWYAASQEETYTSSSVVLVDDQTLLSSLTGLRSSDYGWETPAQYTSSQLAALLQTDAFVIDVADHAGLGDATTLTGDDVDAIRRSVSAWATGRNLVTVASTHRDAETARDLTGATIQGLVDWKIDAEISDSAAAEQFLAPITERYREELAAAREALATHLTEHPAPEDGDRPTAEQAAVDDLVTKVTDAEMRYSDALSKEETARRVAAEAESDVRSQLQVVDPPMLPTASDTTLRALALPVLSFVVVGALLSLASIVLFSLADRAVRFRQDVEALGVDVFALIPAGPLERRGPS